MKKEKILSFEDSFVSQFDAMQSIHGFRMAAKGFWKDRNSGAKDRLALISLMHEELSECVKAIRSGDIPDDKLPKRSMESVELADVILRIMDYASFYGIPVAQVLIEKMEYNLTRPTMHGGKKI